MRFHKSTASIQSTNRTKVPNVTGTDDEAVLNATLISLLDCLQSILEPATTTWTIEREVYTSIFIKAKYMAIADGMLWMRIICYVLWFRGSQINKIGHSRFGRPCMCR
ncbi:hypothetical protein BJX76DRAFT_331287 [Aspergillus varians]